MKILLVVEKEITEKLLSMHLRPLGFEFIHYRNPIKAMDNIEEVDPEIVFFSAEDFPRHWKPFLKLLRETHSKEETVFILLVGDVFPFEEAAKAVYLSVNGIIHEDLQDKRKLQNIEGLLSRYKLVRDRRAEGRYLPEDFDEIEFLFTHPETMKLITGAIEDISLTGINFVPDNARMTTDLDEGVEVPSCSLRIGDNIVSVNCKVIRTNHQIAFQFIQLEPDDKNKIKNYLEQKAERQLSSLNK
jgi:hypothetical protein